mmetsp:Transcript_2936/g.8684  ORF Transcript_2936/g.8684 Transcript_2936/m.8684 type:complete len:200 (-) Transcript_2936:14-613(-)
MLSTAPACVQISPPSPSQGSMSPRAHAGHARIVCDAPRTALCRCLVAEGCEEIALARWQERGRGLVEWLRRELVAAVVQSVAGVVVHVAVKVLHGVNDVPQTHFMSYVVTVIVHLRLVVVLVAGVRRPNHAARADANCDAPRGPARGTREGRPRASARGGSLLVEQDGVIAEHERKAVKHLLAVGARARVERIVHAGAR